LKTSETAIRIGVDERDVHFFSNFAQEWWNPKGAFGVLHLMNPIRTSFIRDGLLSPGIPRELARIGEEELKGFKILDVGCGCGILAEALAKTGAEVVAIDP
jgi:ubiquinone biosynthesis O-methyltransferase